VTTRGRLRGLDAIQRPIPNRPNQFRVNVTIAHFNTLAWISMPSLAKRPDLAGFFSYSRRDDEHSQGALSRLRAQIYNELRLQLGFDLRLWQDTNAIPGGALWEGEIKSAIAEAVFFIPIVTPSAVASKHCRLEFDAFLEREAALGRDNLIFPLLYVRVLSLEKEELWRQDHLLETIARRQYLDWQKFRHRSFTEADTAEKIEQATAMGFSGGTPGRRGSASPAHRRSGTPRPGREGAAAGPER
jgi:TIR domain